MKLRNYGCMTTTTNMCKHLRSDSFLMLHVLITASVHLLKLCRNHILDNGFKMDSGVILNKKMFEDLLDRLGDSEICMAHKLSAYHINVRNQDKQRVYLAAQLLSQSTADAISQLFPNEPDMLECADFVSKMDSWFDVFNSNQKFAREVF